MNQVISQEALDCVVASFHLNKSSIAIKGVEGGYSRNRRSIVGDGDRWVFVKEVDLQLLPDNGETELQWLSKDFSCIKLLGDKGVDIAPETLNLVSGKIKFVDWNWSSYIPKGFGATEFLVDLSRRGLDVTPWLSYLNKELLAAMVCFYAKRCLLEDLAPGNSLRIMQAQSAAAAARMYSLL